MHTVRQNDFLSALHSYDPGDPKAKANRKAPPPKKLVSYARPDSRAATQRTPPPPPPLDCRVRRAMRPQARTASSITDVSCLTDEVPLGANHIVCTLYIDRAVMCTIHLGSATGAMMLSKLLCLKRKQLNWFQASINVEGPWSYTRPRAGNHSSRSHTTQGNTQTSPSASARSTSSRSRANTSSWGRMRSMPSKPTTVGGLEEG